MNVCELSAWESDRSCLLGPLTRKAACPGVAVIYRLSLWLIARQLHDDLPATSAARLAAL